LIDEKNQVFPSFSIAGCCCWCLCWGWLAGLCQDRFGVDSSIYLHFFRFFLALLFLLPILIKSKFSIKKNIGQVILICLFSSINIILFSFGVRLTQASIGQMIYTVVPIIVVIFSSFVLKEKITLNRIIGIGIGFAGISLIIIIPLLEKIDLKTGFLGNLLILFAAFSFSLYTIYSKKIQKDFSPLQISIVFFATTTIIGLVFGLPEIIFYEKTLPVFTNASIFSLFYVSVLGTGVYYLLNQYAIKYGNPLIASMTLYLQPATTLVWANLILGEQITWQIILGGILALIGAGLVSSKE